MTSIQPTAEFILFDLDGTLVDPAPGITGSVQHALKTLGYDVPSSHDLNWVIGPPLRQSFAKLLANEELVEEAVELYRAAYRNGGILQAEPYACIFEALKVLKCRGYRLFLCTSKPLPFARRVIEHFGFAGYFDELYGAELDGRFDDKTELIAHILLSQGLKARQGCMVGDRSNDTLAARQNDMPSVGVTWGYGDQHELNGNGATALCERVEDLPDRISSVLKG
ncbi:HAD hydrolase-like protein [Palleronia caenipelagi]|uniref:HAD family hydrolase n=1 Tax=Palleronia caenipelagi TaxID=2489174 RepID=A0A547PN77_9RHOB|nr:HAD hydrolase-like protein [Palleronia caenipelagi]TRD15603.1 HAD family hydrolase [Palleronia caenipelagi]